MTRVFVTDGRSVAALAAARSLGKQGLSVTCGESFKFNYTFFSRYTQNTVLLGDPDDEPDRFVEDLDRELARETYQTIIPIRDNAALLLAKHRRRFEKNVRFCLSDYETLVIGRDKGKTAEMALKYNVPIPRTFFPEKQSLQSISSAIDFPVLIKPRVSSGGRGIVFARDTNELSQGYATVEAVYGEPIVQEYISDEREHISVAFLFNAESQLRASFAYREYRQVGGSASFAISVSRPDLVKCGAEFLQKLGWRGVANIEFVVDPKDNQFKMLEVNPRFWMALTLAIHAGVDFPYLLHRIVCEGDIEPVTDYKTGCYYRWLLPMDVIWFSSAAKSLEHMGDFFHFRRPDQCHAVISASDPLPILGVFAHSWQFWSKKSNRDRSLVPKQRPPAQNVIS